MCRLVLSLLLFNFLYTKTKCESIEMPVGYRSPKGLSIKENDMNRQTIEWNNVDRSQGKLFKTEDSKAAEKIDTPRRQSRFLGGLAFLAGLSVGGLATAASSSMKSFAKLPPATVTLNVGPSRFAPYFSAYYDPYAFTASHPYFYPNPLGFYPFFHPSKLQSQVPPANVQGSIQSPPTENYVEPDIVNEFDDKGPTVVEDHDEEYTEELKKTGKVKVNPSYVEEELTNEEEFQRMEQKTTERPIICTSGKQRQKKPSGHTRNTLKIQEVKKDFNEENDDLDENSNLRASNTTATNANQTTATATTTTIATTNVTDLTSTNTVENSTAAANNTYFPPFFGYYGGNPQPIDNVDFTTEQYQDYNPIYYGLPNDKPANFHPYDLYPNPQNSFPSAPYLLDAMPDYLNNGFDRTTFTQDNKPPYVSGFRPNFFRSL